MRAKSILIIFTIFVTAIFFSACDSAGPTDPDDPDTTPKSKSVKVEYSRVLPVPSPEGMDRASVGWVLEPYTYVLPMTKASENNFVVNGVSIKTETRIRLWVVDPKMWDGISGDVCKTLKIDDQELVVNHTKGQVAFKYGNDGVVRVVQ